MFEMAEPVAALLEQDVDDLAGVVDPVGVAGRGQDILGVLAEVGDRGSRTRPPSG